MSRAVVIIVSIFACSAVGAEPDSDKSVPTGKWRRVFDNGQILTLTINENGVKWVLDMIATGKGTTTFVAPICKVSETGIAFGYVKHAAWAKGTELVNAATLMPYAFNFKVEDKTLVISSFRMHGFDPRGEDAMNCTLTRVAEDVPAETAAKTDESQR